MLLFIYEYGKTLLRWTADSLTSTLQQSLNFTTNTILGFPLPSQLISYLSGFIFVFKNQPMHRCLGCLIFGKLFVAQQHIRFSSNLHSQFTVIACVFALYSRNKTFKCWEKQHETYFSLGNWHRLQLESLFSAFTLFYLVHRCLAFFSWQIRPNKFVLLFFLNAVSFQCDYFSSFLTFSWLLNSIKKTLLESFTKLYLLLEFIAS